MGRLGGFLGDPVCLIGVFPTRRPINEQAFSAARMPEPTLVSSYDWIGICICDQATSIKNERVTYGIRVVLQPPVTQHVPHISRCFAILRNPAGAANCSGSSIVGGEGEMDHSELIEHLA